MSRCLIEDHNTYGNASRGHWMFVFFVCIKEVLQEVIYLYMYAYLHIPPTIYAMLFWVHLISHSFLRASPQVK